MFRTKTASVGVMSLQHMQMTFARAHAILQETAKYLSLECLFECKFIEVIQILKCIVKFGGITAIDLHITDPCFVVKTLQILGRHFVELSFASCNGR